MPKSNSLRRMGDVWEYVYCVKDPATGAIKRKSVTLHAANAAEALAKAQRLTETK